MIKKDVTMECVLELSKNIDHYYLTLKHKNNIVANVDYSGFFFIEEEIKNSDTDYEIEIPESGNFKVYLITK